MSFQAMVNRPSSLSPFSLPSGMPAQATYVPFVRDTKHLKFPDGHETPFQASDLEHITTIGSGNFGHVNKMQFKGRIMAVKQIRATFVDDKEKRRLLRELEVIKGSDNCPQIVQYFGADFYEGSCFICMELLDMNLDQLYKFVYETMHARFEEVLIGHVAVDSIIALNYLKEKLKIIHRDVKPKNILVSAQGDIKLCDFGIAGELVDSVAASQDVGCKPYMAPERLTISSNGARDKYDVSSDVWSLGITLFEIATGRYPYPQFDSAFAQAQALTQEDPPVLKDENGVQFSIELINFVNSCLTKDRKHRPKYRDLKDKAFFKSHYLDKGKEQTARLQINAYVVNYLAQPADMR